MLHILWFILKWLRRREWAGSDLPEAREEDVDSQGTGSSSFHQGVLAVVQAKQQRDTQDLLVTLQRGAAGGLRRAHRDTNSLKDPVSEGAPTQNQVRSVSGAQAGNRTIQHTGSHCCQVRPGRKSKY